MAFCQVNDVDVVSHAGTVASVVVVTEHTKEWQLAHGNLADVGHQVIGYAVWVFANLAADMCPYGVEVTKYAQRPFVLINN